jgi:hypothetical protein
MERRRGGEYNGRIGESEIHKRNVRKFTVGGKESFC